jgi:predicted Zn-dependent peptidase
MSRIYEFDHYNIHFKTSDRFKTFLLEVVFFNKHDFSRLSVREALLRMLFLNNKKYKTSIDISKKCEDLYDPYMYYDQSIMGSYQLSSIFMKFINPKYVKEDDFFESIIEYFYDIIFNCEFSEESLNFVKSSMINEINNIMDKPMRYSSLKFMSLLDNNDPRSSTLLGDKESIMKLTLDDIKKEYERFINESYIEVSLVTSEEKEEYINIIDKYSKFNKNPKLKNFNPFRNTLFKNESFNEEKDYTQSNLLMLFNLDNLTDREKNITVLLFSEILGGYSVNAKLNSKLREENSICYGVNSSYDKYDNDIKVVTSISKENIDKAKSLIFETIEDMKNITNDDLENAIKRMKLNLKESFNNIYSISSLMILKDLGIVYDSEDKLEALETIKLDEVKDICNKIKYNSSFVLVGVKDENN